MQTHHTRIARRLRAAGLKLGLSTAFFLTCCLAASFAGAAMADAAGADDPKTDVAARISPQPALQAGETDGEPLDMSWILGISLGDSADAVGFEDKDWYEDDDYRFYICPLGSRPSGHLLKKGWNIYKAYSTPSTKRICIMLAHWYPALEWGMEYGKSKATVMEALRKRYNAKDEEELGCMLFREKHGELLTAMKQRFGMEPIEDRLDIAKAIPSNELGGFFPRTHTLLDEELGHVHLFQRGNRMVFLFCSDTIQNEDSKLTLDFVVLDTDLLREATREANQLRQALRMNRHSEPDD